MVTSIRAAWQVVNSEFDRSIYLFIYFFEAGSNISTVALRVVGGGEKDSLEFETVKYEHEPHGTRTREWLRWRGPAAIVNDRLVLSSESAPRQETRNCLTVMKTWS
jgi:hypothetical protein